MRLAAVLFSLAAAVLAGETDRSDLERENRRLRDEIAGLRANDPESALRKAVDEYLATHASEDMPVFRAETSYQGGFVLASQNGEHLLRINLGAQFGWHWYRDNGRQQTRAQFETKRLRLRLSGHAFSKRLTYFLDLEFGPGAERYQTMEDQVSEGWFIYRRIPWRHLRFQGGRIRPRFSQEEGVDDFALVFVDRGLVHEYFTVGRSDGLAILLEGMRGGRSALAISVHNGSEIFDPDQLSTVDDKRYAISVRWSRTLVGEGLPWRHNAYQGDPYHAPESTVVLGIGYHFEQFDTTGAPLRLNYSQVTADLIWRRLGTYASVQVFWRKYKEEGTPGLTENQDEWGAQALVSHFFIPRRMEFALRAGWLGYSDFRDPGGELWEVALAFNYHWKSEAGVLQGHRLRVTLDIGWAENVAVGSRWTNWPAGHVRGMIFRSQVTFLF